MTQSMYETFQLEEGSNSIHVFVQPPKLRLNLNSSFVGMELCCHSYHVYAQLS